MKRTAVVLGFSLVIVMTLGLIGDQVLYAQDPVKRTVLQKMDVPGSPDKEAVVLLAEVAPGMAAGKHWHPGHEFFYVLDGSGALMVKGKKAMSVKAGSTGHLRPKQIHDVKNTSKTDPLKVLVFAIYEKGQPIATMVK